MILFRRYLKTLQYLWGECLIGIYVVSAMAKRVFETFAICDLRSLEPQTRSLEGSVSRVRTFLFLFFLYVTQAM